MLSDVAIAGVEGRRLQGLIGHAETSGAGLLSALTQRALAKLLDHGPAAVVAAAGLYDASDFQQLVNRFASVLSTGDLLGRARVHEILQQRYGNKPLHFAEDATPWAYLPDTLPLLAPAEAINFFSRLVPTLHVDPVRYGEAMQRAAFTLAHQTEQVVLDKVKSLILKAMQTGEDWRITPAAIESVLNDIGVSTANPQYSSMVFRTNMMDSFVTGQTTEVQRDPNVAAFFPVWQYLGIRDGREGEDHRPHFDRYYPSTLTFHHVRGPRVFNCRCGPRWIDKFQWADLQRSGATLSYA